MSNNESEIEKTCKARSLCVCSRGSLDDPRSLAEKKENLRRIKTWYYYYGRERGNQ